MSQHIKHIGVSHSDDQVLALLNSCKKKSNPYREQFHRLFPAMRKKQVTERIPLDEILNKVAPAMGGNPESKLRNWWRQEVKLQKQADVIANEASQVRVKEVAR